MTYIVFFVIWLSVNFFMAVKPCKEKTILIVNGIFLVTIAGLRGIHIGADVKNYSRIFTESGRMTFADMRADTHSMLGYRVLAKVVYVLTGGNYQVMLFVCAAIIIYGFFKFAYRYSPNSTASVFYFVTLFYYFESFNTVRQWIAVAIILLSIIALDEHKLWKFLVLAIISISIHNSAVITLIPYLVIRKVNWNKGLFGIYTVAMLLAMGLFPYLIRLFMQVFSRYATYTSILESGFVGQGFGGEARGRRMVLSVAFLAVILFALMMLSERELAPSAGFKNKPGMSNLFWISAAMVMIEVIIGMVYAHNSFYIRIQSFFSFFSIILLPLVFERITKKWRLLVYIGTNMLFLIATAVKIIQSSGGTLYPYQFFWQ